MKEQTIWIDALEFENYGGWKKDTQFTHLMGSGYLLACGTPGIPVEDAKTTVKIKEAGKYRFWVRAKNWYPSHSPGQFKISVNGALCDKNIGALPSHDWIWQKSGDYDLKKGSCEIKLVDQTGYMGRCAAVLLTNDMDYIPPRPVDEIEKERAKIKGMDLTPENLGEFDVIVCGAGPGGIPAAIAAARGGSKTLIINNRPVVGGNASSEAGVGFNGASARQFNAREGGIAEEIIRSRFYYDEGWTPVLQRLAGKEKNITLINNIHLCGVTVDKNKIKEAYGRNTINGTYIKVFGKMFIDCSGDGWLGYYAGAKYRLGREAKWQYNEEFAPEHADNITMSGCNIGLGGGFVKTGSKVDYIAPDWAPKFAKGEDFGRNIEKIGFPWWLEAPNDMDDIYDAEQARDELYRIMLGYFDYLKNSWQHKERAANYTLGPFPMYDAKRESRRFVGDYTLTQNDCDREIDFPDAIGHAGWPIDIHNPKGVYSGKEGPFFSNAHVVKLRLPYRCFYSVNIENLFFAGRNAGVSHIALGTARVQNTIAVAAQAVGTAAAMCVKLKETPRGIYEKHLKKLRQQLLKDDQYIPGLKNEDEDDLARKATVAVSSVSRTEKYVPMIGVEGEPLPLDRQRATFFAKGISKEIPFIYTKFRNETGKDIDVTVHVREQADPDGYVTKEDLRVVTVTVPKNSYGYVRLDVNLTVKLRYLWMWIDKTPGISWGMIDIPPLDWTLSERHSEDEEFENIRRKSHIVWLEKPVCEDADCGGENLINGYGRIENAREYGWVSDETKGLPQWAELTLEKPASISEIYLTFDTDMNNPAILWGGKAIPEQLVTDYTLSVFDGKKYIEIAKVEDNFNRRNIHKFKPVKASRVKIEITGSGDGKTARMFEVRIY